MKCKKCKYWDKEGLCDAINDQNAIYDKKYKTAYIGYDGYIKTGKNFGCVLFKKRKKKDISKRENEQEVIPTINEPRNIIVKLVTDSNGIQYYEQVNPNKTELCILNAIQSCLIDNKKLTLRNIAQYAKMSPSTIHKYKYLINKGDNNGNQQKESCRGNKAS